MNYQEKRVKYNKKYNNIKGGANSRNSEQIIDRIIHDNYNGNANIIQNRDKLIELYECLNNPHHMDNYMRGYSLIYNFLSRQRTLDYENIKILTDICKYVIHQKSIPNNLDQFEKDIIKILAIYRFLINHNTNRLDNSISDYIERLRLRIIIVNIVEEKTNINRGPEFFILQYLDMT